MALSTFAGDSRLARPLESAGKLGRSAPIRGEVAPLHLLKLVG